MTEIHVLWLPILLSAVIVFALSSVIHMFMPGKGDYPNTSNEAKVMDALRPLAIPPGDYMFPRPASMKEMGFSGVRRQAEQGSAMIVTAPPNGPVTMGREAQRSWFVFSVVVGAFAAYIAGRAPPRGTDYLRVFQFVGAAAFMGYSLGLGCSRSGTAACSAPRSGRQLMG